MVYVLKILLLLRGLYGHICLLNLWPLCLAVHNLNVCQLCFSVARNER